MWSVEDISPSGKSFMVHDATARLARWVVDPDLPWVLIEEHFVGTSRFEEMLLPLSRNSMHRPMLCRAARVTMTLLFRTVEFLSVLDEFENSGLSMLQFDREPQDAEGFVSRMLTIPPQHLGEYEGGKGIRLTLELPHARERCCVAAAAPEDLRRAWERVRGAGSRIA